MASSEPASPACGSASATSILGALPRFEDAVRQVVAVGIPLRNLSVSHGDQEDYDLDDADPSWCETPFYEVPSAATRRWAWVETSAGLAEDEDGNYAIYDVEGRAIEANGWSYQGSGSYRIEVDPSTCPGDDAWRDDWRSQEHPTPRAVREAREQARKQGAAPQGGTVLEEGTDDAYWMNAHPRSQR